MQYTYNIEPADFVALNIHFAANDPVIQKSFKKLRTGATMFVFFGGLILMLTLNMFTPVAVAVYGALAIMVYWGLPRVFKSNMKKNVERTLRSAANKSICGEKTFTMDEDTCNLKGENEDTSYPYSAFSRVVEDVNHYYLFLDDVSALIIPFRAFENGQERQAFITAIREKIDAAKAENSETDVDKPDESV